MGQKIASLEIELAMATGGAVSDLNRFGGVVDKVTAQAIRDLDRIDAATKGVGDMSAATQSAVAFAEQTARSAISAARELNRIEKAGESMVAQLDRQASAFGKTASEIRALKAETAALNAERVGAVELAERIRNAERALYDKEYAAGRRAGIDAEAAAEERAAAAAQQAEQAARERSAAEAAVNNQLRQRAELESLLERNFGVGRPSATQGGATFSALAERERGIELAEKEAAAERELIAAQRQQNNLLAERASLQAAIERNTGVGGPRAIDNGATYSALAARAAEDEARATRIAAESADRLAREHAELTAQVRGSQAAMEADAAAAERLRMATDPLYAATSRLNAEIAESTRLYHNGATAPAEYARQQEVLVGRLRDVAQQSDIVNRSTGSLGPTGKLAGHHMQNLAFQFQDLTVQMVAAAGSSAPFKMAMMAMLQQGMQIQGVMSQAGIGIRGVGTAFLSMSRSVMLAVVTNPILLGIAAAAIAAYGAFKLLQSAAADSGELKKYAKEIGLTKAEIEKAGGAGVTAGDVFKGLWKTFDDATGVAAKFTAMKDTVVDAFKWMAGAGVTGAAALYAAAIAAYQTVRDNWRIMPQAIGSYFIDAVNMAIGGINKLIKKSVEALNSFGTMVNGALGMQVVGQLSAPQIGLLENTYSNAGKKVANSFQANFTKEFKAARGGLSALGDTIWDNIVGAGKKRLKAANGDDKAAAAKHQEMSQAEKDYLAAVKAAEEYIAVQEREAATMGMTAKQLREYADAAAVAKAPTDALKQAIRDAAQAREFAYGIKSAVDFDANVMKPLRDELALYGLVGPARAAAALDLEKEAFVVKNGAGAWDLYRDAKMKLIDKDSAAEREADAIERLRDNMDQLVDAAHRAGDAMERAFGRVGGAIGDVVSVLAEYEAKQRSIGADRTLDAEEKRIELMRLQRASIGDMISASKSLFATRSAGYKVMETAEKAYAAFQLAMAIKSVATQIGLIGAHVAAKVGGDALMAASDTTRAGVEQSNSLATTAVKAVEAVVNAIKSLPFPANIAAGAATAAALVALGVGITGGFGGSKNDLPASNTGTGTVLGDPDAKSDSIKNAINALTDVDTLTNTYARNMAASLKSIDSQIGGIAALVVRAGNVDASGGVTEGFKMNGIGSVLSNIPLIGGILGGLFGSKTKVIGSGLYGGAQTVGNIVNDGFDASYYSDIEKKKKFFGITTGTKYSTQYSEADAGLENQFTLILRSFNDAIVSAAGPLGAATGEIQNRLNNFVVDIGKIDLQGLSGEEIQEKLTAVFGAAADGMAGAAFPGIERFQKVGEGLFETLVRVASTVEAVGASLDLLGTNAQSMSIDVKLALADQFDSVADLTSAADAYFQAYYSASEQASARTAQMAKVFDSLGFAMPTTLASFRQLVEAQDLTSAAGQAAYATLLQLAPAFADLTESMNGAKSAADIMSERQDLERQMLELRGDTAAIRAAELAGLDESNRALQLQIWALQDAQKAAAAADELRKAWSSVGDSIMDEVNRIRGLTAANTGGSYATLLGQFNAANSAARSGDMDAAKELPALSKALLEAAKLSATSRQELDRIEAEAAAALEATYAAISALSAEPAKPTTATLDTLAASQSAAASSPTADMAVELKALRDDNVTMRQDLMAALSTIAGNTGRTAKKLDDVTAASGGDAISIAAAA